MLIVVTGGAGFIGTNLLARLTERYPNAALVSFDLETPTFPIGNVEYTTGDARDFKTLRAVTAKADKVFHLAGELGTHESFVRAQEHIETNIIGTLNVLKCAQCAGFGLLVASKPSIWLNPYTITKHCAERLVEMYIKEYEIKAVIMRFFNVYGPFEGCRKYRKAVPFFINQALENKPLLIYGDGKQEADFVYVSDAVDAAIDALDFCLYGRTIEYGSGIGTQIFDLAELIIKLAKSESRPRYIAMRRGEDAGTRAVSNNANLFDSGLSLPQVTLADGLVSTIEFHKLFRRVGGKASKFELEVGINSVTRV